LIYFAACRAVARVRLGVLQIIAERGAAFVIKMPLKIFGEIEKRNGNGNIR
jgi:hypothetical protein